MRKFLLNPIFFQQKWLKISIPKLFRRPYERIMKKQRSDVSHDEEMCLISSSIFSLRDSEAEKIHYHSYYYFFASTAGLFGSKQFPLQNLW